MNYISGKQIRTLREKRSWTQKLLADKLGVSEKTISKWETEKGLPDVTMLEPLARELQISVIELLNGQYQVNKNRSSNLLRGHFYVCPLCGNVIHAMGEGTYSCCGILLPSISAEPMEEEHQADISQIDHEYYVSINHAMTKEHYISFIAYVTTNRIQLVKLYPEQEAEARFPISGGGRIYAYCNKHGLFERKV